MCYKRDKMNKKSVTGYNSYNTYNSYPINKLTHSPAILKKLYNLRVFKACEV